MTLILFLTIHAKTTTLRVRMTPDIWWKLTTTAPERYAGTLAATFDRNEDSRKDP